MSIFDELNERGLINNVTNEEKVKAFFRSNNGVYAGFDPSFKSLHLGNYAMIMTLKKINNAGYKTYAVIGGATGLIGDPSGKKSERAMQSIETIRANSICIGNQLKKYTNSKIVNNLDFYKNMNILTFLRDVGKQININYLLEKDIIRSRLDTGISYTEFSYSLLQAFDFYSLYKNNHVVMQIGGSDQ